MQAQIPLNLGQTFRRMDLIYALWSTAEHLPKIDDFYLAVLIVHVRDVRLGLLSQVPRDCTIRQSI